jgi:tetratricopeptide (TPR) repeat protein
MNRLTGLIVAGIVLTPLTFAQAPPKPPAPPRVRIEGRGSDSYSRGTRALDERKYEDAIQQFDRVINAKASRADGALYWKAYALNRLGRRDEAIAAIADLRRDYPASHWLNDAQALEVEARQNSGKPVSPEDETNEELKLIAINSLMNADPTRAVPLLEGILKGSSPPGVKERAMFVLTQSRSPQAQTILMDYAKGSRNPDLQIRAIRFIGMAGTADSQQQLVNIYGSATDADVKKEILRSLITSGGSARLLDLARNEKDPALRIEAIRDYSISRNADTSTLMSLYNSETSPDVKREILNGFLVRRDAKTLVELARKETNPELKKTIVSRLSTMRDKDATDYMLELLKVRIRSVLGRILRTRDPR